MNEVRTESGNAAVLPVRIVWSSEEAISKDDLRGWLATFGDFLPDPLGDRLCLDSYAEKLLTHAEIGCAWVGNELAGLMVLYANDMETRTAHLPLISLLPTCRGRGLGNIMMRRAIAQARQRGMERLTLTVDHDNSPAQRLYAALGFRVVSRSIPKWNLELDLTPLPEMDDLSQTPVECGARLAAMLNLEIDLRVKRDDLYPMPGGGIKARKVEYIIRDAIEKGHDVIVTNGGPQSNHARASAIMAARLGILCHLVVVLEKGKRYANTGNVLLMRMAGASMEFCSKDELADRMDEAMRYLAGKGHHPLYIWGGGHCHAGTVAFVDAAREARAQCGGWAPDFLVMASGTGTTQAGLAIGYADAATQVIGVSVAREAERGGAVVQACIENYFREAGVPAREVDVDFRDDWTDGGYEATSPELYAVIESAAKAGYFFDSTYSGKAVRGLVDLVHRGEIPAGSKVLLWHSGGLLNLQADLHLTDGAVQS